MQARKFGLRHLQLIEEQYHRVADSDDAIAVRRDAVVCARVRCATPSCVRAPAHVV